MRSHSTNRVHDRARIETRVRQLGSSGASAEEIATILRREGFRTGASRATVGRLLTAARAARRAEYVTGASADRSPVTQRRRAHTSTPSSPATGTESERTRLYRELHEAESAGDDEALTDAEIALLRFEDVELARHMTKGGLDVFEALCEAHPFVLAPFRRPSELASLAIYLSDEDKTVAERLLMEAVAIVRAAPGS